MFSHTPNDKVTIRRSLFKKCYKAAEQGKCDRVKKILETQQISIHDTNESGNMLLHAAVANGQREVVSFLLSVGAMPNLVGTNPVTPLHLATSHAHVSIMVDLLRAGARINADDGTGKTPLFYAIESEQREEVMINVVRILLDNKADIYTLITHATPQNRTQTINPYLYACFLRKMGIARMIERKSTELAALPTLLEEMRQEIKELKSQISTLSEEVKTLKLGTRPPEKRVTIFAPSK